VSKQCANVEDIRGENSEVKKFLQLEYSIFLVLVLVGDIVNCNMYNKTKALLQNKMEKKNSNGMNIY